MLTLDGVQIGQMVRILGFQQIPPAFRHQLLAMGLTPGVSLIMTHVAPLGDPCQVQLRGYTLSLRKKECQQIEVEYVKANESCAVSGGRASQHCACGKSQ